MTMPLPDTQTIPGSLDGDGAGDRDMPFRFGRRPNTLAPYPFSTRQYGRLLVLRGQVQDHLFGQDDLVPARTVGAEQALYACAQLGREPCLD